MILNHLKKLCVVLLQTRTKTLKNINVNIFKILLFDLLSDYIIFCGSTFGPGFFLYKRIVFYKYSIEKRKRLNNSPLYTHTHMYINRTSSFFIKSKKLVHGWLWILIKYFLYYIFISCSYFICMTLDTFLNKSLGIR